MLREEIIQKINKMLDTMPDRTLEYLLVLLKNMGSDTNITTIDKNIIATILTEDNELLQKLAH